MGTMCCPSVAVSFYVNLENIFLSPCPGVVFNVEKQVGGNLPTLSLLGFDLLTTHSQEHMVTKARHHHRHVTFGHHKLRAFIEGIRDVLYLVLTTDGRLFKNTFSM